MTLDEFKQSLFKKAEAEGFGEYELYYINRNSLSIDTFEGEVEKYSVSDVQGLSFRGIYKGKMGYAYTEFIDESSVGFLINAVKDNATIIESEEKEFIYGGKDDVYESFDGYKEALSKISPTEKIKLALDMEASAKSGSDKVIRVETSVQDSSSTCRIINSKGIDLNFKSNAVFGAIEPIVSDGDKMNSAFSFKASRDFSELNANALSKEAVAEALAYRGAQTVDSNKYRIALRNDVSSSILHTFSGIFSADNVQKGLSLLKNKLGGKIASEAVTIIDNPLLEEGMKSRPFDDEGVAAYRKEVINKGELKTLLYNLKTAAKDGVKSTGNGSKASYSSPVEVAPSNFYFKPGKKSFDEILNALENGLLITEVQGLHSGANPVSGDFSLAAKGFLIKDGKIERAVEQITIAGNFYTLLLNVEEVGSDLKFGFPSGAGYFGSPTIIVKEMAIAGK